MRIDRDTFAHDAQFIRNADRIDEIISDLACLTRLLEQKYLELRLAVGNQKDFLDFLKEDCNEKE